MKLTKDHRLYVRVVLVTLLVGLLLYSFLGEKQPYNDGQGWDGRLYYQMCNHSIHDIAHHGYSAYFVHRFLPFAVVNAFQMVFGYEHTMFFMLLILFIATVIGVWGFFKISNHLQLKVPIEAIAFSFTFYHIGLLRCGYAPYSTDVFALMMGIWFFYFFLKKQKWPMVVVAFAGAFIWQSVWPLACVLFALPWGTCDITQPRKLNTLGEKATEVVKLGFVCIPILCLVYLIRTCIKQGVSLSNYADIVPWFYNEYGTSVITLVVSVVAMMAYIMYLVYPIRFDLFDTIKKFFKSLQIGFIFGAICMVGLMYVIVHGVADLSIESPYSTISATRRILWEPLTLPMKFLECYMLAFGMVIIFFLLYYKRILQAVQNHSYGYLFCIVYILALGSQTEVRFIINMLPFLVFAIAMVMNELDFRKWVAPVIIVAQLVLSHFWFYVNTPELLATTITEDDATYVQYPLQRMFEFSGPWQSVENYYKWIAIFVVVLAVTYIMHRKKWLYVTDKEQNRLSE